MVRRWEFRLARGGRPGEWVLGGLKVGLEVMGLRLGREGLLVKRRRV